jgi:hypothetical protein
MSSSFSEGAPLPTTRHSIQFPPGRWTVELTWQVVHGRAECVAVELWSTAVGEYVLTPDSVHRRDDPEGPGVERIGQAMTTALWRAIPIARWIEGDRAFNEGLSPEFSEVYSVSPQRETTQKRLQDVAKLYRQALLTPGWSRKPTAFVASELHITPASAANRVSAARKAGFLPRTRRGVALGGPVDMTEGAR